MREECKKAAKKAVAASLVCLGAVVFVSCVVWVGLLSMSSILHRLQFFHLQRSDKSTSITSSMGRVTHIDSPWHSSPPTFVFWLTFDGGPQDTC